MLLSTRQLGSTTRQPRVNVPPERLGVIDWTQTSERREQSALFAARISPRAPAPTARDAHNLSGRWLRRSPQAAPRHWRPANQSRFSSPSTRSNRTQRLPNWYCKRRARICWDSECRTAASSTSRWTECHRPAAGQCRSCKQAWSNEKMESGECASWAFVHGPLRCLGLEDSVGKRRRRRTGGAQICKDARENDERQNDCGECRQHQIPQRDGFVDARNTNKNRAALFRRVGSRCNRSGRGCCGCGC